VPAQDRVLSRPAQRVDRAEDRGLAGVERRAVVEQPEVERVGHEPPVGVVAPEEQPVFRARGEHSVGLAMLEADQVVDHDPDVPLVAPEHERGPALELQRGVDARDEPLAARFLVAARAVDLAGEVEAADAARLEGGPQLGGRRVVVLDRVAVAQELGFLEPGDRG
jgi:hypothetical protein